MKLIRFGEPGNEKPGLILEGGRRVDVSAFGEDYGEEFFARDGIDRLRTWVAENAQHLQTVPDSVRLGPPVMRPSKLVCIGLNYADHAAESGMKPPSEPVIFFKATSAIVGPNDPLVIPKDSVKTDWEVELAVVIGKKASHVSESDALAYVAGYMLHNDYSERTFQIEREGQWVKGKSCDTFAPLGPFLATKDEIPDPHALDLWLELNGKRVQNGTTANLIFNIPQIVASVSRYMTFLPGDIISTGTPAGVGMGMNPPRYLVPGDVVELGIEGLGQSRQVAEAWSP